MTIIVSDNTKPRLDKFLCSELSELTRAQIQTLLKSGDILVNGKPAKPKNSAMTGDVITVNIPEPSSEQAQPEDIPLDILYEDDELIALNKHSGMVVHPAAGNQTGTYTSAREN